MTYFFEFRKKNWVVFLCAWDTAIKGRKYWVDSECGAELSACFVVVCFAYFETWEIFEDAQLTKNGAVILTEFDVADSD